jgi:UDP-N-acetylmuramoylalanine--D-glutamate ligase
MQHYAEVKARMFAKQHDGQTALIGVDDTWGKRIAENVHSGANVLPVTVVTSLKNGLSAQDGVLRHFKDGNEVATLDLRGLPSLRGQHNWQNACMAYGAATALGIEAAVILGAMKSFPGLAHRMQQVATLNQVAFVNDSKATNADAAEKALASFDNIFWIAGGLAKAGGIAALAPHYDRIRKAYLIGVSATNIAEELDGKVPYVIVETMARAVQLAAQDAAASGISNAVVLLSPACASFDQYKNFEIRGDDFVGVVSRLQGIAMMNGSAL